jgi:dolichyldiphosphatase
MTLQERVPLSLTFVEFDPSDPLGLIMGYMSLLPLAGLMGYGTMVLLQRDLTSGMGLFGQLVNEGLNVLLKHHFKEPRPFCNNFLLHSLFKMEFSIIKWIL